jgi:hypothetical protein
MKKLPNIPPKYGESKTNAPKKHSTQFKTQIPLEAVKGMKTIKVIASESAVHPLVD